MSDSWRVERRALRSWQRELKARTRRQARAKSGATGAHVGASLPLLTFLRKEYRGKGYPTILQDRATIKLPKVFSFIRHPREAHDVISGVLEASRSTVNEIFLDYKGCQETDLCAALTLGILARELTREWRIQDSKRKFLGSWSDSPNVCTVMRCTGIIRHLGIKHEAPTEDEEKRFEIFDFLHGFTTSQFRRSSQQESSAQQLTYYFTRCFQRLGLTMSSKAEDELVELLGEVMDNAERHSGRNEWWAQAYFEHAEGATVGVCHLAIVSMGTTMADSLRHAENVAKTKARIEELVKSHERVGKLFGMIAPLTEENLLTLYALQDGVSCTMTPGAGSGTVKLIEHFQQLSRPDDGCSSMTVISGSTQILFDHRYKMQSVDGRKVIAFNRSNSLDEPPSSENVKDLNLHFPGTLISLRFEMEKSYIQNSVKKPNEAI